jgi:hypothetical protein
MPSAAIAQDGCTTVADFSGLDGPGISLGGTWVPASEGFAPPPCGWNPVAAIDTTERPCGDSDDTGEIFFDPPVKLVSFDYVSCFPITVKAFDSAGNEIDDVPGVATDTGEPFESWRSIEIEAEVCSISRIEVTGVRKIACVVFCCPESIAEGCTPGYWRQEQHFGSWGDIGQDELFAASFCEGDEDLITIRMGQVKGQQEKHNPTLLQAVWARGGGINALARHAVAALLNAASGIDYPLSVVDVRIIVCAALTDGGDSAINEAKDTLAELNEIYCPLNGEELID